MIAAYSMRIPRVEEDPILVCVYIALIHHPVMDRTGRVVTSSVTSLDLHDLARAARTYGVAGTFMVHPSAAQRRFIASVSDHFVNGPGRSLHPERGDTLEQQIQVVTEIDSAINAIKAKDGKKPFLVGTSAREGRGFLGFEEMGSRLRASAQPGLILFGTSWGLAPDIMDRLDFRLAPIRGVEDSGYNHLSVRAAVAVVLDRLFGLREPLAPKVVSSLEEGAVP